MFTFWWGGCGRKAHFVLFEYGAAAGGAMQNPPRPLPRYDRSALNQGDRKVLDKAVEDLCKVNLSLVTSRKWTSATIIRDVRHK